MLGWDSNDQLYDNVTLHRLAHGLSRRHGARPARDLPRDPVRERALLFFLGEFAGKAEAVCPRGMLRRVLERADEMGFAVNGGLRISSSSCSRRRRDRVREKGYRDLKPITPGFFGYSVLRSSRACRLLPRAARAAARRWTCRIEGLHTETGPGVLEAAIRVDDALEAADKAALFKTFTKVLAQRRGWMATFMAKWSQRLARPERPSSTSRCEDKDGKRRFHDAKAPARHERRRCAWFVGGQQALMPELLAHGRRRR